MPDLATFLPMFLLLLAIGAFAGVISGLLGVGGGIILVPAFYYAFSALGWGSETLMRICIATSLATIIVTSSRSAHAHNRRGAVDWGILRGWAPGIVVGAVIAVGVVAWLQTTALQVIFGLLSLIVAGYLGLGKADWRLGPAMPTGARRVVLSPVVGFLSVLMGIGGGSFGNPLGVDTIEAVLGNIMNYLRGIAGTIAVIFIIVGGIMYMSSGGNKAVMERAKNTLVYAMVGLVVVTAAPLFLSDILSVLKGTAGTQASGLARLATNVLKILLSVVGILGIIGLMNSAVIMFIASGYEEQMKAARKALSYSLISIALAGGSLILLRAVVETMKPGL